MSHSLITHIVPLEFKLERETVTVCRFGFSNQGSGYSTVTPWNTNESFRP